MKHTRRRQVLHALKFHMLDKATEGMKGQDMTDRTEAQKHATQMRKDMCGHIKEIAKREACMARIQVHGSSRRRRTRRRGARSSRRRPTR